MMGENNKVIYFLKKIWPTIYKVVNTTFYFILTLIKAIVKGMIDQIKNF